MTDGELIEVMAQAIADDYGCTGSVRLCDEAYDDRKCDCLSGAKAALAIATPEIRRRLLDDMREWLDTFDPPPRRYEGATFLTHLDAYEKEHLK